MKKKGIEGPTVQAFWAPEIANRITVNENDVISMQARIHFLHLGPKPILPGI